MAADDVAVLAAVFPHLSSIELQNALKQHAGNAEAAAAALLERPPAPAPQATEFRPRSSISKPYTPQKVRASKSWSDLPQAAAGSKPPLLPVIRPHFKPARSPQQAALRPADFPPTLPAGSHSQQPPAAAAAGHPPAGAWAPAEGQLSRHTGSPSVPRPTLGKSPARPRVRPGTEQQQQQQQWQQQQQQQRPATSVPARQGTTAVQQLLRQHGWADAELVLLVLEAAAGDAGAAAALLAEMSGGPASGAHTSGNAGGSSDEGEGDGRQLGSARVTNSFPAATGSRQDGGWYALSQPPRRPAAPTASLSAGECSDAWGAGANDPHLAAEGEGEQQQDAYFKYRKTALQLTRRWQRAARAAAAAYAGGAHGEARQLAAEARRLRQDSLAAHAEAAERIEAHNNSSNSLFELDLHGLHASEAVAALDRRLQLLSELSPDLLRSGTTGYGTTGCGTAAAAQAQLQAGLGPAGLPPADTLSHMSLTSGSGTGSGAGAGAGGALLLRVIVGRGTHSSYGDAPIPRVVQAHVRAQGLGFIDRNGSLDVLLRRRPAAAAKATQASAG